MSTKPLNSPHQPIRAHSRSFSQMTMHIHQECHSTEAMCKSRMGSGRQGASQEAWLMSEAGAEMSRVL
jgi:hypothetical protein